MPGISHLRQLKIALAPFAVGHEKWYHTVFVFSPEIKGAGLIDTYQDTALDYVYSFIDFDKDARPREFADYDLRLIEQLLVSAGNPHLKSRTVHIAGSKGKGSVAAMVASALTTAGYSTGLFTSPHLHSFNERIRLDNNLISNEELFTLGERLRPAIEAANDGAVRGRLTTFELITALGFAYFEQKKADFQVIEVGMGGRLDATNVVLPEVCVITAISFDHMESLGNTLSQIATEKAGIIKPGSIVVTSPQTDEADRVIEETCHHRQAELIRVGIDITWQGLDHDSYRQSLEVQGMRDSYQLTIPLLGQYQLENTATAVAALEVLTEKGFAISRDNISQGLAGVDWPGRLQILRRDPIVVVDGAHNADSANRLKEALRQYFDFERAILIVGVSSDKDASGIISELAPVFDLVIATHSIHPRAMPTASLVTECRRHGVTAQATEDISIALPLALSQAGERDLICVTGSLVVVAGAIEQTECFL